MTSTHLPQQAAIHRQEIAEEITGLKRRLAEAPAAGDVAWLRASRAADEGDLGDTTALLEASELPVA